MLRQIPVFFFVAFIAIPVAADTIKVPGDQATIQAAVDAAVAGDVISIGKGTYNETVVIDAKTDITLKGKGKPIVDGSGANTPFTIQNSTGITLVGLIIDNGVNGVSITGSTTVVIQKCAIGNAAADAIRSENSTGVVVEKCEIVFIGGHGVDFSDGGAGATSNSIVAKNIFVFVTGNMVNVDGAGNLVEKNKAGAVGGIALVAAATTATVQKNKMGIITGPGILVDGNTNSILKNKILQTTGAGIQVNGDNNLVEKNKIAEPVTEGLDVEGSNNQIMSNKVTFAGGSGLEVGEIAAPGAAIGNLLEKNKAGLSVAEGFMVSDGANTLRSNKASGSGTFDLRDNSLSGTNVYETNKFKTEQID